MRIILASDEHYFAYIYVSVLTLFQNNRTEEYLVTYIYQNVGTEKLDYLKKLGDDYHREIECIEFVMPEEYKGLPSYAESKTTYAKFLFSSMFPEDVKVLYLDPDTIILGSIRELLETDMGDNLIAGVTECLPYYHKEASKMKEDDQYINGGMVLCNLAEWRKAGFEKKSLKRLKDTKLNLNYDQGILNELCSGRIKVIHPKYNVLAEVFEFKSSEKIKKRYGFKNYYSEKEIKEALEDPVIIHFTGFLYGKPMSSKCTHPYSEYFWDKLKSCPWEEELFNVDINFKQKLRKWTLHHMPYSIYLLLENILDFRRMWILRRGKSC